jgi:ribose 5-phosphate isomerase B
MNRPLISVEDVLAVPAGGELSVPPNAIITPLAHDAIAERQLRVVEAIADTRPHKAAGGIIALGADHGGLDMKVQLYDFISGRGYEVNDLGTYAPDAVDYPDIAYAVAQLVASGRAWRGIIVDGAGIGSCMAANKVPGIRAALCYDEATARNSREHNDANVLTLGGRMLEPHQARQIVHTWLTTDFGGGRHARRVDKIMDIERRYSKGS